MGMRQTREAYLGQAFLRCVMTLRMAASPKETRVPPLGDR
jgi:hypothetical protein